jgi:hypothetical protein
MPIEINVSRIKTKVSPREGLGISFNKNLPITGGWGYSKEDAVVIPLCQDSCPVFIS